MITLESLNLQTLTPEKLGELLIDAKKAYYTTSRPIMDDHTYDTLEEILRQKLPYHRVFTKAGHPNFDTGWPKKKHVMTLGSQNKVTDYDDLVHYFQLKKVSTDFVIQPKCDGISLEIIYKNGNLVEAITRGDGLIGDIITQNVVKMQNLVLSLPKDLSCSVRCEIVVTKKDFEKLNTIAKKKILPALSREGDPAKAGAEGFYSNPRNAASGLSQRLDSLYSEYCSLYAVDVYPWADTESKKISRLQTLGFTPVESHLCHTFDDIETIYQIFLGSKRLSYPYEIDGLVVKINDSQIAANLGSKNNRPKFQVAYKFPAVGNLTTVKSVDWQVGPMGSITPVAQVEPIELSGAIVAYASLANHDLIVKKDLNVGDIVSISRRGDVIPHIASVVTKVNPGHIPIPTNCPSCNTPLIKEDKFLKCPNPNCLPQIIGSLNLFCNTLGILGLSSKTISKLYTAKLILTPGDFFKLTVNDISNLDNLGELSGRNIVHQIQSKRTLSLAEAFDAAIIPHFSAKRIQQLISAGYDTPDKLLNVTVNQIAVIPGFKTTLAQKIVDGLILRRLWIESILDQIKIENRKSKIENLSLSGLTFCITGDLSLPRNDIIKLIESNGGQIMSSVSSKTNYLLSNQVNSASSKFVTAKKLGIKIITESQLQTLLNS